MEDNNFRVAWNEFSGEDDFLKFLKSINCSEEDRVGLVLKMHNVARKFWKKSKNEMIMTKEQ